MKATPGGSEANEQHRAGSQILEHACMHGGTRVCPLEKWRRGWDGRGGGGGGGGTARRRSRRPHQKYCLRAKIFIIPLNLLFSISAFLFIHLFWPYADWCATSGPRRSTARPTNHSFRSCSWELSTAKHPLTEMKSHISQADKLRKYSLPGLG